jgi:D-alanyl-D-alanine dipeptidase
MFYSNYLLFGVLMLTKKTTLLILISLLALMSCMQSKNEHVVTEDSIQLVVVLTDSLTATEGQLYTFERDNNKNWKLNSINTKVVIGRTGLGLGKGLHKKSDLDGIPEKIEGDGRSPAGIFNLSSVFGYLPEEEFQNLKMPYVQLSKSVECIDDPDSKYYNKILSRDEFLNSKEIDWASSEKMFNGGIYYELGIVVDHNCCPTKKAEGSCIFLHNWADSNETTAGCTAMVPNKMMEIILWLDKSKNPILVQLTKNIYFEKMDSWELPTNVGYSTTK